MSKQDTSTTEVTDKGAKPDAESDAANLGEGGVKALHAERDARKAAEKSATELQAKLDQIEQANLSELEKAQRTAQEHEQAATAAKSEALRWRIAAKHGISDEDAETFLTGSDEAALTRQAERLSALATATPAPTTPKPDRTQGGAGDPPALNSDALENSLRSKLGIA